MLTRDDDVAAVSPAPAPFSWAAGIGSLMSGRVGRRRIDARGLFGLDMRELRVLIATDPPNHTRLRRLLSRAFTPRAIAELEPHLRQVCAELVDDLLTATASGTGDLVAQLAFPFPVIVIAELLGIPPRAARRLQAMVRRTRRRTVGQLEPRRGPANAGRDVHVPRRRRGRSEEHTSELQSLMRSPYAVFCLKK